MAIAQSIIAIAQQLFFILAGFAGIGFLIGFHELGHFIFCKLFKIHTPSFSIGFGPRLIQKKIGDTIFTLSAIPFGGYVEIAGAAEVGQGEQKEAGRKDKHSFSTKPYYQKMLVMAGGILFNLIFAYVALVVLFATGIPKSPLLYPKNATTVIRAITPDSAAEQAHLQPQDKIIAINNQPVNNDHTELLNQLEPLANKPAVIQIERNGQLFDANITLGSRETGGKTIGTLGVEFDLMDLPPRPIGQAISEGFDVTKQLVSHTFFAFKSLFTRRTMSGVGGPLMVIQQTIKGAEKGIKIFFLLLAFISVNLAVLNVIPLPIMDGGQALFYTIEAIIRRPLPEQVRLYIHYACWIGIVILAIYLTISDIGNIFGYLWK